MKLVISRYVVLAFLISGCSQTPISESQTRISQNLQTAESLIDAFYSFDADKLAPFLTEAPGTASAINYYQGWAEGGNYKIVERQACASESEDVIRCSITVEDDPMLALKIDFHVTDTFTITFLDGAITSVETSSNDLPIYYKAIEWVMAQMPEVMEGPCQGFFAGGPTPGDCARAVAEGYRKFAESDVYADILQQ